MNCEECEMLIYLEEDASEQEVRRLTSHLDSCESCRHLMEVVHNSRLLIGRAREYSAGPLDSGRLTGKVMSGIFPENISQGGLEISWLRWIRYGFTLFSICIILLFYAEWTAYPTGNVDSAFMIHSTPKEASLISPSVRQLQRTESENRQSVYKLLKQNNSK